MRGVLDLPLEHDATSADQVVADVSVTQRIARVCREPPQTAFRHGYHMARDVLFRLLGESCQFLNRFAILCTTLELHPAISARRIFAENSFRNAHGEEQ